MPARRAGGPASIDRFTAIKLLETDTQLDDESTTYASSARSFTNNACRCATAAPCRVVRTEPVGEAAWRRRYDEIEARAWTTAPQVRSIYWQLSITVLGNVRVAASRLFASVRAQMATDRSDDDDDDVGYRRTLCRDIRVARRRGMRSRRAGVKLPVLGYWPVKQIASFGFVLNPYNNWTLKPPSQRAIKCSPLTITYCTTSFRTSVRPVRACDEDWKALDS